VERVREARDGAITGLHDFVLSALRDGQALNYRAFRDGSLLDAGWNDVISLVD
jgi:hypothetical protein